MNTTTNTQQVVQIEPTTTSTQDKQTPMVGGHWTTTELNTQRVILDQLNKLQNDIINLKLSIDQLTMINKHMIVDIMEYKNKKQ